jgi:hypothetical protein
MKLKMFVLAASGLVFQCALAAQTSNPRQWVGVWEGQLDGKPGVTVTLGNDAGDLEGTIVFNVVAREGGDPQVIGHDAHVLTHVNLNDSTLAFHVIRLGDERELHLTMKLTEDGKAVLQCSDCGGPGATELSRIK